jgi:hypothetical protein
MAITQAVATSFKVELMTGTHDFSTDTFKVALYSSSATLDQTVTAYTTSNEVSGTGYTAGGNTLTVSVSPTSANNSSGVGTAYVSFSNTSWSSSTITARGALVYNSSKANRAVAVLDFGGDKVTNNDTLTINFPTPDANNAIVRIS